MQIRSMLTGHTRIVGVIGDPIEHSRSPQMHNAALAKAGLDYVYVPFHVRPDDLAYAITGFKAVNVVGINVTLPHKQAVIRYLTSISREAELIGAVNTLTFVGDEIHGDNTDAPGVLKALEEDGNMSVPVGKDVVVLGAGGSARAVVVALALAGVASITIANRTVERAISLAEEMQQKTDIPMQGMGLADARLPAAVRRSLLLINTATASMDPTQPLLVSAELASTEYYCLRHCLYTAGNTSNESSRRARMSNAWWYRDVGPSRSYRFREMDRCYTLYRGNAPRTLYIGVVEQSYNLL